MAKRTAALGDDEKHHEHRWENRDINRLKALLRLTVRFIENELEETHYIKHMPL